MILVDEKFTYPPISILQSHSTSDLFILSWSCVEKKEFGCPHNCNRTILQAEEIKKEHHETHNLFINGIELYEEDFVFATLLKSTDRGIGKGASGSPVLSIGVGGIFLHGIVSSTTGCTSELPFYTTSVFHYRKWIYEQIMCFETCIQDSSEQYYE